MIETRNKEWRNNQSGFGYRLLTKLGWSEGNGLGKNKQGSLNVIKVEKRAIGLGLGSLEDQMGNHAWSETSSSYENLLNQLRGKYSTANVNKTQDIAKNQSDESDQSEIDEKMNNNKIKEKQVDEEVENKSKQIVEKKMTTKLLSHHKVLKSKNVSLYSQEDLAAILGFKIDTKTQSTQLETIESSVSTSEVLEISNENKDNRKKKEKRKREIELDEQKIDDDGDSDEKEQKKRKRKEKKSKK